jgi:Reverse transcriptase (RNA-dependent DNA polymerase)
VLQSFQGFRYFSVCDCSNAYLSIPLDEETSCLTAFVTRRGMYKWSRLCAGISSGGAVFNQLVQSLFFDMFWTEVLAFLDDLTLPSKTVDEGIKLLETVSTVCIMPVLSLRRRNVSFCRQKSEF